MIDARDFVEAARTAGFTRYSGVPCSYLTPFINYVINDETLSYVSAANEGDAVAIAAGSAIGGKRAVAMMQNSGLGNAVSPLTSLAWVFRIPLLLITTHRGAPGEKDEPQHELMGRITPTMLESMEIPWAPFPAEAPQIAPALKQAQAWFAREQRPYGFIMRKDTVAPCVLARQPVPIRETSGATRRHFERPGKTRPSRVEALRRILGLTPVDRTVVIATTGYTGRELYALEDRPNQLYMVGSMGCASSLGLGLALARPDMKIVVIDGDGAALMRMGNLATAGTYAGNNLVHIVLDNGVHDSTGAQATVSANVDFAAIASACGYGLAISGDDTTLLGDLLKEGTNRRGPLFAHLKITAGTIDNLPRPKISPPDVLRRLMAHIGTQF
ncbi:MAG: phosphonopyruvate decarboxylase [Gammaproteobacteria bacterium]|nr:phosphonopyruvate decarboxylase [Gammaproteobacteria bacterium]